MGIVIVGNCLARGTALANQPWAVLKEAPDYCSGRHEQQEASARGAAWTTGRGTTGRQHWRRLVCSMSHALKSFAGRDLPGEHMGTRKESPFLQGLYNAFYWQSLTSCLSEKKKKFLKDPDIFTKSGQWRVSLQQRSNKLGSWHITECIYSFSCWWEFGMFSVFCSYKHVSQCKYTRNIFSGSIYPKWNVWVVKYVHL